MTTKFYKYSNKADLQSLPLTLIILLGVMFIFGIIYNYLCSWIPLVYLNVLTTFAYASIIALLNYLLILKCNIRSQILMMISGLFLSIIAIYLSWVTFSMIRSSLGYKDGFMLMFHGNELLRLLPEWAQSKTFILNNKNPEEIWSFLKSSSFYYLVWIFEALIIIVVTEFSTYFVMKQYAFCESCHEWCDGNFKAKITDDFVSELTQSDDIKEQNKCLKQSLLIGNFKALLSGNKIDNDEQENYLEYSINYCEKCEDLAIINVERHVIEITEEKTFKQKIERKTQKDYFLTSGLLIPMSIAKKLMSK